MKKRIRAPKGTFDIVYPLSERLERILSVGFDILTSFGYRRISTPIIESTELFVRGIGESSDIVTKEMYTFSDRGGESLTLRPEGTAPVIRAYLERGLHLDGIPQKLFYFGPMFRRERPQAGRYRQFHQLGAEAIGSDDPALDAEVIAVSDRFFRELGISGHELVVNSVGCSLCRPPYVDELKSRLKSVSSELCGACRRRIEVNPLRVFDCKEKKCRELMEGVPLVSERLCGECSRHFEDALAFLRTAGVGYRFDGRLVRGLDYYTRTAFEFIFEGLGAQNAICGGGRYDYLAEELGGPHTPGVGFSIGMERLLAALDISGGLEVEVPGIQVFVAAIEGTDRLRVFAILNELRDSGLSADTDYMGRSLKAQMKQADRLGARFVVIVGGKEFERGEAVLRDLDVSEQWTVSLAELPRAITSRLEP